MKFDAESYVDAGGWDYDDILATARDGVSEEDLYRLEEFFGADAAEEASRALRQYCIDRVAQEAGA